MHVRKKEGTGINVTQVAQTQQDAREITSTIHRISIDGTPYIQSSNRRGVGKTTAYILWRSSVVVDLHDQERTESDSRKG